MPGEQSAPGPFPFPGLLHILERRFCSRRLTLLLYHPKASRGNTESYLCIYRKRQEGPAIGSWWRGWGLPQLEDALTGEGWAGLGPQAFPGRTQCYFHSLMISAILLIHFGGLFSLRPSLCCRVSTNIGNKHVRSPVPGTWYIHSLHPMGQVGATITPTL